MKFKTQFNSGPRSSLDYSRQYEQTYIELAPYARNEKGEFLNDSPFPKLIEGEKINIQEKIDSYKDDVDLYKILEKVAVTGDISYLNQKQGFYADISDLPNNYNDLQNYYKSIAKDFKSLPDDLQNMIKSGATDDDINNYFKNLSAEKQNINNSSDNLDANGEVNDETK